MTTPTAVSEALQRQKSVAGVRLDAYYKQLLELFKEIGVPEADWEGRLGNIWGHVVTTMQEVRVIISYCFMLYSTELTNIGIPSESMPYV